MFKSRRFWIMLVAPVVLMLSAPALWYFWWYPNSWHGRFDRVQMGMTEAEVEAILGPKDFVDVGNGSAPKLYHVYYAEEWKAENGRTVTGHTSGRDAGLVFVFDGVLGFNNSPYGTWATHDGFIGIELDSQRQVATKTWYRTSPSFDTITFLKSLFHL